MFDFFIALAGIILLSPLFLIIAFILAIVNHGSPLFFQKRPGKNARIFNLIKFKTMNDQVDANGKLLPDHMRITAIGKFIRLLSLDEIPQLVNVLKGDMSLIGPRPLLVKYLPLYNKHQARRHEVLPGITGWAQVNGRNALSWKEKFELDVFYVDNISLKLDLKIMLLTLAKVIKRDGINSGSNVTMEAFTGN